MISGYNFVSPLKVLKQGKQFRKLIMWFAVSVNERFLVISSSHLSQSKLYFANALIRFGFRILTWLDNIRSIQNVIAEKLLVWGT